MEIVAVVVRMVIRDDGGFVNYWYIGRSERGRERDVLFMIVDEMQRGSVCVCGNCGEKWVRYLFFLN